MYEIKKYLIVTLMLFAFIFQFAVIPASAVSMEELKLQFKEKTGEEWNDSTSRQRQDFMNILHGSKKKKARKKRVEGVKVPYYIVEGYARDHERKWEFATEEEREDYIKEYKKKEKDNKRKQEVKKREKERHKAGIERKQVRQKLELKRKRDERERKKIAKKSALKKKRMAESKRLEDAKLRLKQLQEGSRGNR